MSYATLADLAAFMGMAEADLPTDAQRKLDDATDTVKAYTMGRIDPIKDATAARRATLAQYEMNSTMGGMDVLGTPTSFSAGSFSMSLDPANIPDLAPKARKILFAEGLLSRGVNAR